MVKLAKLIEHNLKYITQTIQFMAVSFLFLLTLMPVELRWAEADVWLIWSLPVLFMTGIVGLFLSEKPVTVTKADIAAGVWITYYIFRIYIGGEYPCATVFLKTCTSILLYIALRVLFSDNRLSAWCLIALLLLCGSYEAVDGITQMIKGTSRHHLFPLTGNFQNPGPYSAYIMIGATVGVCALQEKGEIYGGVVIRKILLVLTAIMLVVLPSTWCRAAFVGLGICALWVYRNRYWNYRYLVWSVLCALAVGLYFFKQGSADGRGVIWMASLTSWTHTPWMGVGIGGFRHACAEGIAELWISNQDQSFFASAGVADYAYNTFFKILVEQGVIGAILSLTLTLYAMFKLYRQSKPLFMGMASLLVFSMFSYPFELLPYRIIAVVIIAWSQSLQNTITSAKTKMASVIILSILMVVCIVVCNEVKRRTEADKGCYLFSGMHNAAFLNDYYELLPDELDNPQFLFDFAKTLRENRRYRDSNAILRMGTLVSADPMFYVLLGNNYWDEGFYAHAEKRYKKAFWVMPNRLYPLYQLMKLFQYTNDTAKSVEYAREIVQFKEKVSSPATEEIKKEAESIINKIH